MTRLSAIYIYPIKSLRGIALDSATVTGGRLNGDREWLLVDGRGRFMHQRDYPQMARLGVARTSWRVAPRSKGCHTRRVRRSMMRRHFTPCTRCAITTTDQITGARPTREPLRTLATYRRVGNEVVFGHYVVALRPHGTLRVGDSLVIQHSCPGQMGNVIRTVE